MCPLFSKTVEELNLAIIFLKLFTKIRTIKYKELVPITILQLYVSNRRYAKRQNIIGIF